MSITADTNIVLSWCGLVAVTAGVLLRASFQRGIVWWGNQIPKTHIWVEVLTHREVRDATRWDILHHSHPAWDLDRLVSVLSLVVSCVLGCVLLCAGLYGIPVLLRSAPIHLGGLLLAGLVVLANLGLFGFVRWIDELLEKQYTERTLLKRVLTTGPLPIRVDELVGGPPTWLVVLGALSLEWILPVAGSIVGLLFTISLALFSSSPYAILLSAFKYAFLVVALVGPCLVVLLWLLWLAESAGVVRVLRHTYLVVLMWLLWPLIYLYCRVFSMDESGESRQGRGKRIPTTKSGRVRSADRSRAKR